MLLLIYSTLKFQNKYFFKKFTNIIRTILVWFRFIILSYKLLTHVVRVKVLFKQIDVLVTVVTIPCLAQIKKIKINYKL